MGLLSLRAPRLPTPRPPAATGSGPSHSEVLEAVQGWPLDRRVDWEERAAIRETEGGLSREVAEVLAFLDLEGDRP